MNLTTRFLEANTNRSQESKESYHRQDWPLSFTLQHEATPTMSLRRTNCLCRRQTGSTTTLDTLVEELGVAQRHPAPTGPQLHIRGGRVAKNALPDCLLTLPLSHGKPGEQLSRGNVVNGTITRRKQRERGHIGARASHTHTHCCCDGARTAAVSALRVPLCGGVALTRTSPLSDDIRVLKKVGPP